MDVEVGTWVGQMLYPIGDGRHEMAVEELEAKLNEKIERANAVIVSLEVASTNTPALAETLAKKIDVVRQRVSDEIDVLIGNFFAEE